MIILGYIFTAINYIFYCVSRFMHNKKDILLMDLIAKIFTVLGLYCLDSLSGTFSFTITFFLLIIANIKERIDKKWTWGFILFQTLYAITLVLTYKGISSLLVFTTSSIGLACTWWFKPQKMRLVGGCNNILYLTYQISIRNWAGLLEIFVIISNFTAYLKYRQKIIPSYKKG